MKAFNVRVVILEPGIIDTAMARRISDGSDTSIYPHRARMAKSFSDSLQTPASPAIVAQKLLEIATSDSWQLRHPVGPTAVPYLEWRRGMTDEEWVDLHSSDDKTYFRRMEQDMPRGPRQKA
jgi:NAD(P)-dependent dehydrogenase (short-subunit alcohol dehydrogenase family)